MMTFCESDSDDIILVDKKHQKSKNSQTLQKQKKTATMRKQVKKTKRTRVSMDTTTLHENLSAQADILEANIIYNHDTTNTMNNELLVNTHDISTSNSNTNDRNNTAIGGQSQHSNIIEDSIASTAHCNNTSSTSWCRDNEAVYIKSAEQHNFVHMDTSGKHEICVRIDNKEYTCYLNDNDTLEDIFEKHSIKKMKYKGAPVSKYLTLTELGYTKDNIYFDVFECIKSDIRIKVNVDSNKTQTINIDSQKRIQDIVDIFTKEASVVFNGMILKNEMTIKDAIEDDDVIDMVML